MCVYLYFCLPELKGRTVAEIQEMFQAGLPARKFKDYVCQNENVVVVGKEIIQDAAEKYWIEEIFKIVMV